MENLEITEEIKELQHDLEVQPLRLSTMMKTCYKCLENDEDFLWFLEDKYYSSPEYSETEDEEEKMIALYRDTNAKYDGKIRQRRLRRYSL